MKNLFLAVVALQGALLAQATESQFMNFIPHGNPTKPATNEESSGSNEDQAVIGGNSDGGLGTAAPTNPASGNKPEGNGSTSTFPGTVNGPTEEGPTEEGSTEGSSSSSSSSSSSATDSSSSNGGSPSPAGNDEDTEPVCFTGGDGKTVDTEPVDKDCCRLYEFQDFKGKYFDFCVPDGKEKQLFDYSGELYGYSNWNNEMSSYRCGSDVHAKMCFDEDEACTEASTQGAAPGEANPKPALDDDLSAMIVIRNPDDPNWRILSVYDTPGCEGKSHLIKVDQNPDTSYPESTGHKYNKKQTWSGFDVESAFMTKRTDLELYGQKNHLGLRVFTLRNINDTSSRSNTGHCYNNKDFWETTVESLRMKVMTLPAL